MQKKYAFTSWVTLLSFLGSANGFAQGQGNVSGFDAMMNTIKSAVFVPQSAQFNLQTPQSQIQRQMDQCDMSPFAKSITDTLQDAKVKSGVANLIANKFSKESIKDPFKGKDINTQIDKKTGVLNVSKLDASYCDASLPDPNTEVGSCTSVYGGDPPSSDQKVSGNKKLTDQIQAIKNFRDFKKWQSTSCIDKDKKALDDQLKVYQCKQGVLAQAVAMASQMMQTALQQNQAEFGKAIQYQNEVGDQIRQVDEILGPEDEKLAGMEGGNQFKGLLGVQRALTAKLAEMNTKEKDFKSRTDDLQKRTDSNEQKLDAERMGEVGSCMRGQRSLGVSGGRSLTCYKPVILTAKDGTQQPKLDVAGKQVYAKQSCGPMEYVRSQVAQSAFITSRGVMRSQARTEDSEANAAQFDAFSDAIMRDLGAEDEKLNGGDRLVTRESTWEDISKKYSGDMAELSQKTGIDIQQQMNVVAGRCFTDADVWKKQQKRSSSSRYNTEKSGIQKDKNVLTGELNNGLSDLNKSYGETMAVLSGQAVTVNRYNCTTDDPAKMQGCFVQMKQSVSDLLEGNGMSTTSKVISGGTMPPPYNIPSLTVPCKGVNGCVTVFQGVRKAKKNQLVLAQKQTVDFVNKSNAQIKSQLSGYAAFIGQLQASVKGQFDGLNGALASMGANPVDNPKNLSPEALKQGKGPGDQPGPYENPEKMSNVLSGMIPPDGLMDFQNNGVKDVMAAAKEKLDKKADALKQALSDIKDTTKDLLALQTSCVANKDRVGQADCSSDCLDRAKACNSDASGYDALSSVINGLLSPDKVGSAQADANAAKIASANSFLESMNLSGSDCNDVRKSCRSCSGDKVQKYNDQLSTLNSNSGTGK